MPNRNKHPTLSRRDREELLLQTALAEVGPLIDKRNWGGARELLERLNQRFPRQTRVLRPLAAVCQELGDTSSVQKILEELVSLDPGDPQALLALGGSYLQDVPFLANDALQRFVAQFPEHPEAADVRKLLSVVQPTLPKLRREMGLDGPDGEELAVEHDRITTLLAQNRPEEARKKS